MCYVVQKPAGRLISKNISIIKIRRSNDSLIFTITGYQCWLTIDWTMRNKLQYEKTQISIDENMFKMASATWRPYYLGLYVLAWTWYNARMQCLCQNQGNEE